MYIIIINLFVGTFSKDYIYCIDEGCYCKGDLTHLKDQWYCNDVDGLMTKEFHNDENESYIFMKVKIY